MPSFASASSLANVATAASVGGRGEGRAERLKPQDSLGIPFDEPACIARAQAGDEAAFGELFQRFYPMIHAFCYRNRLSSPLAEDAAQETFVKAARALGSFRNERGAGDDARPSFKAWLYRIAVNTLRDHRREAARQSRIAEAVAEQAAAGPFAVAPSGEPGPVPSRVEEALLALPEDLRMAVALTFYDGMSHAQAAAVLGCAETTVSWRIFRAKRKLKAILERKDRP